MVSFGEVFFDSQKSPQCVLLIWLLTASFGLADQGTSFKHHTNNTSSSQTGYRSTSTQHHKSKHSTQKTGGDEETAASPSPTPKKRQSEESKDASTEPTASPAPASVATISPENIREFDEQPPQVQQLIRDALALTEQNLTYTYGSSDPAAGGMDCSGFIYYVLTKAGFKDVPRDSSEQYSWIRQNSYFHAVLSRNSKSFEFRELRPGDLMFWSGTYKVDREIPITHVMIYLGTEKSNKKPVMVGASDGRSYGGIRRNGVSVFDFKMPSGEPHNDDPDLIARFEGYGAVPGLRDPAPANEVKNFPALDTEQVQKPPPKKKEKPLSNGD
jgi:cell wall-associated NlpC family hydrolase